MKWRWPSWTLHLGVESQGLVLRAGLVPMAMFSCLLPACGQAYRSVVPTLEAPCPTKPRNWLLGHEVGSSLLAGAFAAACVKRFGGSEISGQGDSYLRFSLPFCRVKLGRCWEFSPLSAPAPQLPFRNLRTTPMR